VVKRGRIIFELADISEATAKEAARLASNKLPLDIKFVVRRASAGAVARTAETTTEETQGEN
jgi:ribosomal protein L16/L10AE